MSDDISSFMLEVHISPVPMMGDLHLEHPYVKTGWDIHAVDPTLILKN